MIKKKVIALGISMVMATTVLSGCGLKSDTPVVGDLFGLKSDEAFVVDKLICSRQINMLGVGSKINNT